MNTIRKDLFLVAEIGLNHNGSFRKAIKLIDHAKKAGFDAVKFQTYKIDEMLKKNTGLADYQKKTNFQNMRQMLKKYSLSHEQFFNLRNYCSKKKIEFMSTPFDLESAIFLNRIGVKIFKISSGDLDNYHLLSKIKKFGKPMIISTGMATNKEIYDTINFLNLPRSRLGILHCVSDYPTELKNTYFSNFEYLKKFNYTLGFSDHTIGNMSSAIAVALGSKIIEKHITISKKMIGPDHASSLPISELELFTKTLREVKKSISSKRQLTFKERKTLKVARKSLYYNNMIKKGSIMKYEDMIPMRPANNHISPKYYEDFLDKKLKKDKKKHSVLKKTDFE